MTPWFFQIIFFHSVFAPSLWEASDAAPLFPQRSSVQISMATSRSGVIQKCGGLVCFVQEQDNRLPCSLSEIDFQPQHCGRTAPRQFSVLLLSMHLPPFAQSQGVGRSSSYFISSFSEIRSKTPKTTFFQLFLLQLYQRKQVTFVSNTDLNCQVSPWRIHARFILQCWSLYIGPRTMTISTQPENLTFSGRIYH